jgi:hypothetical protein
MVLDLLTALLTDTHPPRHRVPLETIGTSSPTVKALDSELMK